MPKQQGATMFCSKLLKVICIQPHSKTQSSLPGPESPGFQAAAYNQSSGIQAAKVVPPQAGASSSPVAAQNKSGSRSSGESSSITQCDSAVSMQMLSPAVRGHHHPGHPSVSVPDQNTSHTTEQARLAGARAVEVPDDAPYQSQGQGIAGGELQVLRLCQSLAYGPAAGQVAEGTAAAGELRSGNHYCHQANQVGASSWHGVRTARQPLRPCSQIAVNLSMLAPAITTHTKCRDAATEDRSGCQPAVQQGHTPGLLQQCSSHNLITCSTQPPCSVTCTTTTTSTLTQSSSSMTRPGSRSGDGRYAAAPAAISAANPKANLETSQARGVDVLDAYHELQISASPTSDELIGPRASRGMVCPRSWDESGKPGRPGSRPGSSELAAMARIAQLSSGRKPLSLERPYITNPIESIGSGLTSSASGGQ